MFYYDNIFFVHKEDVTPVGLDLYSALPFPPILILYLPPPSPHHPYYSSFGQPRFADGNMATNLALVDAATAIATKKGITMGQLALAFLQAHGPDVIPIPGTSTMSHLQENLAARDVILTPEELEELREIFKPEAVVGDRYSHMNLTFHAQKGMEGPSSGSRPASRK